MPEGFPVLAEQLRRLGYENLEGGEAPDVEIPELPTGEELENLEDDELFRQTVGHVRPLRSRVRPPSRPKLADRPVPDAEDAEALAALADLCRRGSVSLRAHREYVEEWVAPQGRLYLDDLRRGRFAIQAHLDLHGLGLTSARSELERFVKESVRAGYRLVRIIHGRGLHSPDGRALMKESVERWLRQRRVGRYVLAFTSASKPDGGCGAVYVLLKSDRHAR